MKTVLISDSLEVTILHQGAEISSIKDKNGLEFIWQAKPDVWPRHAPVLFPIVGRLNNNAYSVHGQVYSLPQHGFARDRLFTCIDKQHNRCTFQLTEDAASMTQFPFNFILELSYTLEENTLTCAYKITNSGANTLPFSVGAHPGFNCPLLPEENFEDYYLELDGSHFSVTSLNNGLRTKNKSSLVLEDNRLALHSALFDWDALVFENQQIEKISLCSKKSSHRISMTCEGWPYFGIWSKKGCREFICLEPWFGVADKENASSDFFKKEGLIFLKAQEVFECQFSISCS